MAYTDEQRAEALTLYLELGTAETSRQTGIPKRTIRHWANQANLAAARNQALQDGGERLAKTHANMREELRLQLLEKAVDLLERIDEPHTEYKAAGAELHRIVYDTATSSDVKNYASSVATLVEKYRLEMGETTGRTRIDSRHLSSVDEELIRTVDEWKRQLEHTE